MDDPTDIAFLGRLKVRQEAETLLGERSWFPLSRPGDGVLRPRGAGVTSVFAYSAMASPKRSPPARSRGLPPRRRRAPLAEPKALFLDFDGVLHPTLIATGLERESVVGTGLFGWLPHLASALQPHPEVVIVVHSTWRYTHDHDELRELLNPLSARVVGATPRGPRYESILWWLHLNPTFTEYRILDDAPQEFPNPLPAELVVCNPREGVSSPEVLAALKRWLGQ